MYQDLTVFRTAHAMARHAGKRQAAVAVNIANADTPEYRARTIASFADSHRAGMASSARITRPGHMSVAHQPVAVQPQFTASEPSPNGNTVSLEHEMLSSVEVAREHNRALAIYRHALGVIRTAISR